MSRIFISHSSIDNFEAIAVREWLAFEGWNDVFLDLDPDRGIAAGERWERALYAAATRCEAVIFLVSANWLASGWCLKEYALARGLNKKLFAVIIDPGSTIAELPPELKGTWQVVDLSRGQDMDVLRTQVPGSHEEKHVAFSREALRRLKRGLEKAGLDPKFFAWPPENDRERAPYRGLKPLDSLDAGIFFGRDAPIVEATDRLRGLRAAAAPRLMVILGASGAGKSSFLRAGLLPRLARDDSEFLPLPLIRPERAALFGENGLLAALAMALPSRTRADLRAAIRAGAVGVRPLLAELCDATSKSLLLGEATAKPPTIVIAIDQAEELFRADGAAEGDALLALIRDLTADDVPAVIAIFAIRSDSYDALEHAKPIEGLRQRTLPLLPMPRGAYKDVIEGPARRCVEANRRLAVEPQLTQRLLDDLDKGGGSDGLPLLAFTLEQLYLEFHPAGTLRLADYEVFGGLRGTIDAAVARALARADADPRIPRERTAREVLLRRGFIPWLAGIDPDTKNSRRNIARRTDIPDEAKPLIDLLVEERLLSTDIMAMRDPVTGAETRVATVEPAHEALLRQWGMLQGWLAEDFGLLAALEGIKRAARDWDANARSEAWLAHHGQRLAEGLALDARPDIAAKLDTIDRTYLAGCRAKEERAQAELEARRREREEEQARRLADAQALASANRRTARRTGIGLVVALLLSLAAGMFGFYAEREKTIADAKTLEAQAQSVRAQRALAEATKTADTLVFDLADKFRNVVGVPASIIKAILDPALKLQDELIGAGESDPDLRRSQAAALMEAGLTFLTLGDTKDALADALKAHEIMVDLAKLQPGNEQWQKDLSVSLSRIADAKLQEGDQAGALAAYQESLAIRRVLAKDRGNAQAQLDLAVGLMNIGDVERQRDQQARALAAYEEGAGILRILAKDQSNAQARRDLSASLDRIGDVKLQAGDQAGALAAYQESLAICRDLAQDKSDATAQLELAVGLTKICDVKLQGGDQMGALAACEESVAILRELAKDRSNAQAQRNLAVGLERIGDLKLQARDQTGALAAYEESLAIRRDLAQDEDNATAQRELWLSLDRIADVKGQAGYLADARAAYEASLSIARRLAKDKSNTEAQTDLVMSLMDLAQVSPDADQLYREALALLTQLDGQGRLRQDQVGWIGSIKGKLAPDSGTSQ